MKFNTNHLWYMMYSFIFINIPFHVVANSNDSDSVIIGDITHATSLDFQDENDYKESLNSNFESSIPQDFIPQSEDESNEDHHEDHTHEEQNMHPAQSPVESSVEFTGSEHERKDQAREVITEIVEELDSAGLKLNQIEQQLPRLEPNENNSSLVNTDVVQASHSINHAAEQIQKLADSRDHIITREFNTVRNKLTRKLNESIHHLQDVKIKVRKKLRRLF